MSENQTEKRTRGRPLSRELFLLPPEMRQELGMIGFFDPSATRWRIWPFLRDASDIELKYRFRAAFDRAMSIYGKAQVAKSINKSWKQVGRYLEGAKTPLAVLDHVALMADLPPAWVSSGDASTAREFILDVASDETKLFGLSGKEREYVIRGSHKIVSEFPSLKSRLRFSEDVVNAAKREVRSQIARTYADFGDRSGLKGGFERFLQALADGYVLIKRYDLRASAGSGAKVFDDLPASAWPVPKEMLGELASRWPDLTSFDVMGDSMEPTLHDGQPIIFDRTANDVDRTGVYVIAINDELFVKRVRRVPTAGGMMTLSLISDNPAYPEITLDPETQERVRIIGRVVWPNTSRRL